MRVAPLFAFAAALVTSLVAATNASAQYPVAGLTATGRSFTLSDAGWKVFIPSTYYQRPGSVADVIVHVHGDPQTYWNNAQWANLNAIIVTVNYNGLSSAYETPFSNSALFSICTRPGTCQGPRRIGHPRHLAMGQDRRLVVQRRLRSRPSNSEEFYLSK
jgi:hypothetical protein